MVEAAPDVAAHGLGLLRKLEDTDASVYLASLADGEAIRVVPDTPYPFEYSEHLGEIMEGAYQPACQRAQHRLTNYNDDDLERALPLSLLTPSHDDCWGRA